MIYTIRQVSQLLTLMQKKCKTKDKDEKAVSWLKDANSVKHPMALNRSGLQPQI